MTDRDPRGLFLRGNKLAAGRDHDQDGGPVPNVVLSPALKKFFDELEVKRSSEIGNRKETPR